MISISRPRYIEIQYIIASRNKVVYQIRADETGTASDQHSQLRSPMQAVVPPTSLGVSALHAINLPSPTGKLVRVVFVQWCRLDS